MLKKSLQVSGLILVLILFLSISITGKPIFSHVYSFISPATIYMQDKTEDLFHKAAASTEMYTKRLFENSIPKVKDSVRSNLASPSRVEGEPQERIKQEDKEELDQLIKNH